ncbi:hypothetical protein RRG08_058730 [Elysia crispata]|uniref:Uncharacterized protein n=1 Tax=Elysia crispata TaxID=231223 RepID=A0AAE1D6D9_9GAST|nr:hypothetical protein RRG08_058730 [Elysia crispata]
MKAFTRHEKTAQSAATALKGKKNISREIIIMKRNFHCRPHRFVFLRPSVSHLFPGFFKQHSTPTKEIIDKREKEREGEAYRDHGAPKQTVYSRYLPTEVSPIFSGATRPTAPPGLSGQQPGLPALVPEAGFDWLALALTPRRTSDRDVS